MLRPPLALLVTIFGLSCRPAAPAAQQPPQAEPAATTEPTEQSEPEAPEPAPVEAAVPGTAPPSCEALPGWRYEKIVLPPPFAPSLPAGVEVLWFAPGMFDPNADDYFTYAFSLAWSDANPRTSKETSELLRGYYDGLMRAVAGSRQEEPQAPVEVALNGVATSGTVSLSDEFNGGAAIDVALRLAGDASCTVVYATARPNDANWEQLARADACLCASAP